jgi:serine/threonine protein kinase
MRKIPRPTGEQNPILPSDWNVYAAKAAEIANPYIVRVYRTFENPTHALVLMEYCLEGSLRKYLDTLKMNSEVCSERVFYDPISFVSLTCLLCLSVFGELLLKFCMASRISTDA